MSLPSYMTPGMPYASPRSATFGMGICFSRGTEIAYWLFCTSVMRGRLWMPAQFSASWKSPWLVLPSPRQTNTTSSSPRSLAANAMPAACGHCVATGLEPETMRLDA